MFRYIFFVILVFLWVDTTFAVTIKSIVVKGNKKIESAAIINKVKQQVGSELDTTKVRDDIASVFSMGFFEDVQLSDEPMAGGVQLVVTVLEKATISVIDYKGNSELDDTELKELTKIKPYEIVNFTQLDKAVSDIQKAYEDKGYLLVKVTYSIEPIKGSDFKKLVFNVLENEKLKVKRISFIGNKNVTSGELKSMMYTQEGGFFSFVSGSGNYKKEAFEQDLKIVNLIYLNKGYVQVKISQPEISITPDRKYIYITIRVDEGPQFDTGEVHFGGDVIFEPSELYETISIDESKVFVFEKVQADMRALEAKFGDLGYAYVNIIPKTMVKDGENKVDLIYEFDKGKKVYFGKINVSGNSKTRDKVIRRELTVNEGELYNFTRKEESIANVKRLGYFDDVQFLIKTPPGRDDLMDLEISVKERNTGSFQLGAGYSSFSGAIFNAQLNQINFLGYGYKVSLGVDYSKLQKRYNLNFTDPYFMDTMWTLGADIYRNENNYFEYFDKTEGAAIRVGHPIYGRYFRGFVRYKLENTEIKLDPNRNATDVFNQDSVNGSTSSITLSTEYDKRDDRFSPSNGLYSLLSLEYAGLGGHLKYLLGQANLRYYHNLFWSVVWRNNLSYSFISPLDREVPFNRLFRLGGPYNMRGFQFARVGKRARSQHLYDVYTHATPPQSASQAERNANVVVGGQQEALLMSELEFNMVKEAKIKGVVFFDAGVAEDDIISNNIRSDVGFGIRWFSPMGPLRFELGYPLNQKPENGENSSEFNFAIGAPF